jgi:hypothetical protein
VEIHSSCISKIVVSALEPRWRDIFEKKKKFKKKCYLVKVAVAEQRAKGTDGQSFPERISGILR